MLWYFLEWSIQSAPVSFGLWDMALKLLSPGPRSDVTDHLEVANECYGSEQGSLGTKRMTSIRNHRERFGDGRLTRTLLKMDYFETRGFSPGTTVFPSPQKPTIQVIIQSEKLIDNSFIENHN